MAGEWAAERLGEVCREIYRYPSFYGMDRYHDGVPVVRGEHLLPSGWISTDWSEYWFVSEEYSHRFPKTQLEMFDVVMSVRGSIGTFAKVGSAHVGAQISPNLIRLSPDPERVFPAFFYYALRGSAATAFISSTSSSSAVPAIRAADIKLATIPLPPLPEQRAIAHILGTLDDKIELNRRMNETLEGMARALFKSWFVDFDPVRAKLALSGGEGMRGEQPAGLAPHIAALFPDELVETELGLAPRGWRIGSLNDCALLNPEHWIKQTRPTVIKYVDLTNTKWGRIERVAEYPQQDAPSRAQRVLRPKDTIVGTVRPANGSYAYIMEPGLTGSTGFAVLRPYKDDLAEFVYLAATNSENIKSLAHLADGAAYPAISPETVSATRVFIPTSDVMQVFSHAVQHMLVKIAGNEREARSLAALRDTLLPRLISGELRVADAERIVGRSV